jgi:hypothetical protein
MVYKQMNKLTQVLWQIKISILEIKTILLSHEYSLKFVQLQSPLLLRSGMEWALKAYNPLREQAPVVNLIC